MGKIHKFLFFKSRDKATLKSLSMFTPVDQKILFFQQIFHPKLVVMFRSYPILNPNNLGKHFRSYIERCHLSHVVKDGELICRFHSEDILYTVQYEIMTLLH